MKSKMIDDINKGFIYWRFNTGKTYNSHKHPDWTRFVCECIRAGRYRKLVRSSYLYIRSCFYFGFITQEEMEDWEHGGIVPTEDNLPKTIIMCFDGDYRNDSTVCADAWHRKQNREPNEAPLLIC